jgi:ATP-binding cassette subfamily F protein uup
LERLVIKIEKLEAEREEIYEQMAEPSFYQKEPKEIAHIKVQLEALEDDLLTSFERWESLENIKLKTQA